jgi:RNA polymerase sigma-70 factor (ECF subfamily)
MRLARLATDVTRAAPAAVARVTFVSNAALIAGVEAGSAEAAAELYDRHARAVDRTLMRVLGPDSELEDMRHDVFLHALGSIGSLREPEALEGWLRGIAVFVARRAIEKRARRRRWMSWFASDEPPDVPAIGGETLDESRAALRAVYAVLERMPTEERVVFALRQLDGWELSEVAEQMGLSLATTKRRFARATDRFETLARAHPVLVPWMNGGA